MSGGGQKVAACSRHIYSTTLIRNPIFFALRSDLLVSRVEKSSVILRV